jgi:hypothetical protein
MENSAMTFFRRLLGTKGAGNKQSTGKTCPSCGQINLLEVKFCSTCGSEFLVVSDHFDAFISYRRETGSDLASLLKMQLENRFHKRIFLDVNELQVGKFDEELLRRIEEAPNFILILSRASLDRCANKSDWLKREIMHALRTGRNIIPVLTDNFSFPSEEVWSLLPPEMHVVPSLNGVTYSHIYQDSALRKIASFMKTDIGAHEDGVFRTGNESLPSSENQDILPAKLTVAVNPAGAQKDTALTFETRESVAGSRTIPVVPVIENITQEPKPEVSSNAQLGCVPKTSDQLDSLQERLVTLELVGTSSNSRTPKKSSGLTPRNLALVEQYACVVAHSEGVRIYDLTRETHPVLVSAIHYPHDPIWFQPVENLGILRASSAGVVIVDLSNMRDPKPIPFDNYHDCRFKNCGLAVMSLGSLVVDLSSRADVAHRFLDFTDPFAVRDLGKVDFGARTAAFHENWLLLGSSAEPKVKPVLVGHDGVREMEPILLDSEAGLVVPKSIAAIGSRLYVIGERRYASVLLTYDLSEIPHNLPILNEQPFGPISFASQMTHHGSWLCLVDEAYNGRIHLFDVSEPDNINRAATLDGMFHAAAVRNNRVYVSDERDVWVYAITQVTNKEP